MWKPPQNLYWPLPADYGELSVEGQRQARVAVCCKQDTPFDLVVAWNFFRRWYLGRTTEEKFYKDGFAESPDFHFEMVYALAEFAQNAWAAPRGSAKSTVIAIEISLLLSLTRPFYQIMLGLSVDRQVEIRFDQLMGQLQRNELILQDFGAMQPKRGHGIWCRHYLHLVNGAIIAGQSVMGKKRGGRPNLFILDDPENDPDSDSETSRLAVIEKFETVLFKQIIPMLKPGSSIFWVGTLIDRKSFLYRATMGSDDPRFDCWNRCVLRAIAYDDDDSSKYSVLWPEMWPKEELDAKLKKIGPSAFASEYCNSPISPQDRLLSVDTRKNEYTVEGEFTWKNPLSYAGKIRWQERVFKPGEHRIYLEKEKPYNEMVCPMFRILLFDYAYGKTSHSDYACIVVLGFDTFGCEWILEVWLGRANDATLMRLIYEKGLTWRVKVIGIESVGAQKSFEEASEDFIGEQIDVQGELWRPRIYPIKYPSREDKAQRIASTEWRYEAGRIKYPAHLQNDWPYDQLYAQTADFTMDLALLQHDDVIDTLAMAKYVIKGRGRRSRRERQEPGLLERIKRNKPIAKGIPLICGGNLDKVTDEMLAILRHRAQKPKVNPNQRRIERPRLNVRRRILSKNINPEERK